MDENPHRLRRSRRLEVVLPARCRSRSGFIDRVTITDLSEGGCRVESRALTLREGDLVVVSPGVIEGICGQVCWVKGHRAGIVFLSPLYGPVVDHIHRQHGSFLGAARAAHGPALRLAA